MQFTVSFFFISVNFIFPLFFWYGNVCLGIQGRNKINWNKILTTIYVYFVFFYSYFVYY